MDDAKKEKLKKVVTKLKNINNKIVNLNNNINTLKKMMEDNVCINNKTYEKTKIENIELSLKKVNSKINQSIIPSLNKKIYY